MYPIFSGSTNEILLSSSCSTVSLNWHSSSTDKVVEFGELDNEGIVVVLEKRLGLESRSEDGLQVPARLFLPAISSLLRRVKSSRLGGSHHAF
jgi:hypothetical protein